MFEPSDPRTQELLRLAAAATSRGLTDLERPHWRELVGDLLGRIGQEGGGAERRKHVRAAFELEVDILSPDEMASLATSTVGAGGLSLRIRETYPAGTPLELSIKLDERPVPLFVRGQVMWSQPGLLGVAFTEVLQIDRELLEGIAVREVLRRR